MYIHIYISWHLSDHKKALYTKQAQKEGAGTLYNFHLQPIHFNSEQRPSQEGKLKGSPRAVSLHGPHAMKGSRKEEAIYIL